MDRPQGHHGGVLAIMTTTISERKLKRITHLEIGAHSPDSTWSLMEAVAYVAGESWSDSPECTCPVLASYGRSLNDYMPYDQRQRLIPIIPSLIGTKAGREVELRRAYLLVDVAVRVMAPMALRAAHLDEEAHNLASLPEITNAEAAEAAWAAAEAAGAAAWAVEAARAVEAAWAAEATAWAADTAAEAVRSVRSAGAVETVRAAARSALAAAWAVRPAAPWDVAIDAFERAIAIKETS